ncbi:xylulokinase [Alsobacter sp. SYSU BS001988]
MTAYLGVDVGTSAVKAALVDADQTVLAVAEAPLAISRPHPLWSEQDPDDWWAAVRRTLDDIARQRPGDMARVAGLGLSGQMHGAVLLGADDRPLRPAMLWNDGRAEQEARRLGLEHPGLAALVGVAPMPGFTGPKIPWLARREPDVLERLRTVLLPKDYVRLKLTGERITDMSDAAGTWWLDQRRRRWSPEAAAATGLPYSALPALVEGSEPAGALRADCARDWGLPAGVVVAGGGGDAAAGAVGVGAIGDGDAFLSLGTSGQLFVAGTRYRPAPEAAVHAFCHALPGRWFQMGAMLNGASCLAFASSLLGVGIDALLAAAEAEPPGAGGLIFLPYLAGERTPNNDPHARGVLFGLTPSTSPGAVARAVLEGVAYSFADAQAALVASGTQISQAGVIGGGARSRLWVRILASVLDVPLARFAGGERGPAFGAARLARLAATGEAPGEVCAAPPPMDVTEPDPEWRERYRGEAHRFRALYQALRPHFRPAPDGA